MWTGENTNNADAAIDAGFDEWENVSYSNIVFVDKGQTNAYDSSGTDQKNVIIFSNLGTDAAGLTVRTAAPTGIDTLKDVDIFLSWWFDPDGAGPTSPDTLFWSTKPGAVGSAGGPPTDSAHPWRQDPRDVGDVITHEIGHLLGVEHGYGDADNQKTMYYTSARRDTFRRTLTDADKEFAKWVHPSGSPKPSNDSKQSELLPQTLYLEQNYPNPFNPETHIKFHTTEPAVVSAEIETVRSRLSR